MKSLRCAVPILIGMEGKLEPTFASRRYAAVHEAVRRRMGAGHGIAYVGIILQATNRHSYGWSRRKAR